jgi:prepilin-type N-terminal cleavage/methylation domain-containing protein
MQKRKTNSGLTLIEILVGLALSSMVFIVASSLVVSMMSYSTKSKESQALEQTKNDLAANFSTSVRWAGQIEAVDNGSEIKIDGVEYKLAGDQITKGGDALTSGDVKIDSFVVNKYKTSMEINVDMESKQNSNVTDTLNIIISPRGSSVLE